MKNPLHYQLSDYDCGPTTMLNAVSYLFEREDIPPEVIRNIMLYSLDCYSAEGVQGKSGTSRMAKMFLSISDSEECRNDSEPCRRKRTVL